MAVCAGVALGAELDHNRLADAIRDAEGNNPHFWYGITKIRDGKRVIYPEAKARIMCIQTIVHAERDWNESDRTVPFMDFLARRYCGGDWRQWEKNVSFFYRRSGASIVSGAQRASYPASFRRDRWLALHVPAIQFNRGCIDE